ncbi:hypothetical protein [Curtobacterium sp. MCBD17_040]|uniref:DUF7455 domain-containing protein n=1 Tax=Curtobacterium sp. MCBD17_040 TaxID=2175674 RepID=UPI0021AC05C4|nr:hypothetical protein [Curtobacterium sp. MCBD17_040]WIB65414.1 hypothetical protein DEI94_18580 [Curtobacterium sp. MCBD17_040]
MPQSAPAIESITPTATTERTFTSNDRCDACGAQAYVAATFLASELLFCGHHYRKHQNAIEEQAAYVLDRTDTIAAK